MNEQSRNALLRRIIECTTPESQQRCKEKWLLGRIEEVFQAKNKRRGGVCNLRDVSRILLSKVMTDDKFSVREELVLAQLSFRDRESTCRQVTVETSSYNVVLLQQENDDGPTGSIVAHFFENDSARMTVSEYMPETIAEVLIKLEPLVSSWDNDWETLVFESKKMATKRLINENAIDALLRSRLEGKGIRYAIKKQKVRVKVAFDIGHKQQIVMAISHNKFITQIDSVISTVLSIKNLIDASGQTFSIIRLDPRLPWNDSE